jgi:uncharacterized protein YndB with AHSA1/START domain
MYCSSAGANRRRRTRFRATYDLRAGGECRNDEKRPEIVVIAFPFKADIHASAERVFSLLAELRDYDRWLPRSSAFNGTHRISEGPIAVGTTYVEPGPLGVRHGTVTELVRPTRLSFHQPMTMRPRFLGVIDIHLTHTIAPHADFVSLLRVVSLTPHGAVTLAMPLVVRAFRVENERMMRTLKDFAEKDAS